MKAKFLRALCSVIFRWSIAHGAEDAAVLKERDGKAVALAEKGRVDEAEKEFRADLEIRHRKPGPEHPDTLHTRSNRAGLLGLQEK